MVSDLAGWSAGIRFSSSQLRGVRVASAASSDGVPSRPSGSRGDNNKKADPVAAALASAKKAASNAESALDRVTRLPSAKRQNHVRLLCLREVPVYQTVFDSTRAHGPYVALHTTSCGFLSTFRIPRTHN